MIDYNGKVALVTGAASGIGRALAMALSARGARLVLVDLNAEGLAKTAAETGPDTIVIVADLADPLEPACVIEQGFAEAGRIDLVCSNAGITNNRRIIKEAPAANGGRLFAVNLFSAIYFAQAYAKALEQAGLSGRMMLTGSENSLSLPATVTKMGLGLYGVTKHGLLILAEWMRQEFAGRTPIDVHILLPGPITTALSDQVAANPAGPQMDFIPAEQCAELALKGMDLGLFYIPTHAHLLDDMRARYEGVEAAINQLGLSSR
jgi:NAD(P)-dependent dehydrogenase (short-subunit alcohol dehydrogenase family)